MIIKVGPAAGCSGINQPRKRLLDLTVTSSRFSKRDGDVSAWPKRLAFTEYKTCVTGIRHELKSRIVCTPMYVMVFVAATILKPLCHSVRPSVCLSVLSACSVCLSVLFLLCTFPQRKPQLHVHSLLHSRLSIKRSDDIMQMQRWTWTAPVYTILWPGVRTIHSLAKLPVNVTDVRAVSLKQTLRNQPESLPITLYRSDFLQFFTDYQETWLANLLMCEGRWEVLGSDNPTAMYATTV